MLALIALVAVTPVAYSFPTEEPARFDINVTFDGFVPILGGKEGTFQVSMSVDAKRAGADPEGNPKTVSELAAFQVKMNEAILPLDLSSASGFFPKTTISQTPQGRVLATDAPDKPLPIKLPGLDVKRMPDITYLPIEFPENGIEEKRSFTYTKRFGDSDVTYEVTPTRISEEKIELDVKVRQSYEVLEDDLLQVVTDRSTAAAKVATEMKGDGRATFSRKLGYVTDLRVEADSNSKVEDLQTGRRTERKLKTILSIKAKKR